MGEWKRLAGFGVATVCIGLSLFLPWWSMSTPMGSIEITLSHIEVCAGGTCQTGDASGAYGIISTMTFAWGLAVLLMVITGGVVPALAGQATKARALIGCVIYLGLVPLTASSLPEYAALFVGPKTAWFWCGVGGPLIGLVTPFVASIGQGTFDGGRGYVPLKRAVEPVPLPAPVEDVRDTSVASASPKPLPAVRFGVSHAELREDALVAVADGRRREIPWSTLAAAIARELHAGGEPQLMVDLITVGAPPVRLLPSTELTIGGAAGSADGHDRLRRALAFARAMNPQIEVEGATADFMYRREALPSWSLDELARYDARYR